MANKLFSLFNDKLSSQRDLISGEPQTLDSISINSEEQEYALKKIKEFEQVKPRVDYSTFSNFVFFNSALDYFNITGEKIINEYPYDGSRDLRQQFLDDLDDYQKYVVTQFPKNTGHLYLSASSGGYVKFEDTGFDPVSQKTLTSLLSPGTGSISFEFWVKPPSSSLYISSSMVALQKVSGSNQDGYSIFFTGSQICFQMVSGSYTDQVFATFIADTSTYVGCIFDKDNSKISILTGSTAEFPVIVSSATLTITESIDIGQTPLYIGTGTFLAKASVPAVGYYDNFKIWNYPRTLDEISGSFNVREHAQSGLIASWLFNETGSIPSVSLNLANAIVYDYSGHKINGRIQNYVPEMRISGSLLPYDESDIILNLETPELQAYIAEQQLSGSNYDRNNPNIITSMFPDQYFVLEQYQETDILENFLYVLARNFDYIKIRIDQLAYVLRQNYTEFNQTPEALLSEIGKFFGWEFTGNFLSSDINQYVFGKNIFHNTENNKEIERKLFQIKNEFWKRTLINLIHIYKTKGTRESVESLLRIYGVNKNFVKLKEFGLRPNVGISTERIYTEKSVPALAFGSGSLGGYLSSPHLSSSIETIETRVRFPTTSSANLISTIGSGSIWHVAYTIVDEGGTGAFPYSFPFSFGATGSSTTTDYFELRYHKAAIDSVTGSLELVSPEGNFFLTGAQVFDNKWYNISLVRNLASGTNKLAVHSIDRDSLNTKYERIFAVTSSIDFNDATSKVLSVGTGSLQSQFWAQEVRVWDKPLDEEELEDHALNYQSYGTNGYYGDNDISLHWRLRENITASLAGVISTIEDVSDNLKHGTGNGFVASVNPYKRFLNEYNFIASPNFGWTENLVRILDKSEVELQDAFTGSRLLALEFNMIDSLNEDISQMISSIDDFNFAIGQSANRYRSSYNDLEILRKNYFKRLQGRLNFRVFADMLEFFDRSFVDMVRRLIPAHSIFLGDQFVVESHMLERPKFQWEYRRQPEHVVIEGSIQMYNRK